MGNESILNQSIYHLTHKSGNKKLGPVAVSTSGRQTCPDICPHKNNGCYAEAWPLRLHWDKLSNGLNKKAMDFTGLLQALEALPGSIDKVRINQAGDLPSNENGLSALAVLLLDNALSGRKAWSYTHHKKGLHTLKALQNLVVNVSCDSPQEADKYKAEGYQVCLVVPENTPKVTHTPDGNKVIVCPAQTVDEMTCEACMLCANPRRKSIVGFRAHGNGKKRVERSLKVVSNG